MIDKRPEMRDEGQEAKQRNERQEIKDEGQGTRKKTQNIRDKR